MSKTGVAVLGIFVADLAFRAGSMPAIGETIAGSGFAMGPGGKGSNQAVAAARAGAEVTFISKIGQDAFGDCARDVGSRGHYAARRSCGGADRRRLHLRPRDTRRQRHHRGDRRGRRSRRRRRRRGGGCDPRPRLRDPARTAGRGRAARPGDRARGGQYTVFNPAPAVPFRRRAVRVCATTSCPTRPRRSAPPAESRSRRSTTPAAPATPSWPRAWVRADHARRTRGAAATGGQSLVHVRRSMPAQVVETTGAGDAFIGGFAAALAEGASSAGSRAFRLGDGRDFRDARGDRACHADGAPRLRPCSREALHDAQRSDQALSSSGRLCWSCWRSRSFR